MEEKIVEYLKEKYDPVAIILFGSRVSGKAKPNSDWDFAVFVDKEVEGGTEIVFDQTVDADIVSLPLSKDVLVKRFGGAFQTARVVFDANGKGQNILEQMQALYEKGRNLSEREKKNRINFITRRLDKMRDSVGNDGAFFFHLGVLYEKALQYWFELKENRWRPPLGIALRVIKEEDPEYFQWVATLYGNNSNKERLKAATKIHQAITK